MPYSICATPEGNFFVGFGKGTIRLINSVSKQMELIVEKPHPIRLDVNRTYDAEDPDVSTKYIPSNLNSK